MSPRRNDVNEQSSQADDAVESADGMTRRGALRSVLLGGVSAAVAASALAASDASPADAATGTMQYGATNDAGTTQTNLMGGLTTCSS